MEWMIPWGNHAASDRFVRCRANAARPRIHAVLIQSRDYSWRMARDRHAAHSALRLSAQFRDRRRLPRLTALGRITATHNCLTA